MIQLNLLPDVKKEFLRAQSTRRKTITISIMVTVVAVGLTLLAVFYVYAVQKVILYAQTQDIKGKASQLGAVPDVNKYLTIQNQLAQLSTLHGSKNNFSRLLDFLPTLNPAPPQNITLQTLNITTTDNTIEFKGHVTDYGALTTFKDTLTNATFTYQTGESTKISGPSPLFTAVNIASATYQNNDNTAGVDFDLKGTYDPAAFMQQNVGVTVTVPNKETTGSVVGSPQAIFGGDQ